MLPHCILRNPALPGAISRSLDGLILATMAICMALLPQTLAPGAVYAQAVPKAGVKPIATGVAPKAEGEGQENPVLARVNRHEIRLSDVYRQIESLSLGDQIDVREQLDKFTNSVVTEEILFQAVLSGGLAADEGLRGKLKTQVVEYLIEKHVRGKINVSDDDVRRYYAENRDLVRGLHVRVRQIQMKSRAQCEQLQKRIRSDEDFAREAAALSLHKRSAAQGGDMGYLMPVMNARSLVFQMEVFKMRKGEMRIFDSPAGCHLVKVMDIIDPPDPSFDKIKEAVLPTLEREQEQALLQALITEASRDVSVEFLNAPSR